MSLQDAFLDERPLASGNVRAGLFYLKPMAEKPYTVAYRTDEAGELPTNAVYEEHAVTIHDARPETERLDLDREGAWPS